MALLFMQGFEDFASTAEVSSDEYVVMAGTGSIQTGRINGNCLRLDSFGDECYMSFPVSTTTHYFGFAFRPSDVPSGAQEFVELYDENGTLETRLYVTNGGTIQLRRGSTLLGETTGLITTGAWNYIVVKIFADNSTGTAELWLNGTKELNLSSQDTLAGTGTIKTMWFIHPSSISNTDYDDVYFGDNSGSDMTDQQGDCHIEMLTPTANGTTNNFTASPAVSNYLNVDDGDTPDDDTTYNHSSTATDKELYAMSNIVGNVDTVHAVQVRCRVRKEDAGNRGINTVLRSSATEADSGEKGLNVAYGWRSHIYENDPNGGGNWTESAVNAIEAGFEIST